MEYFLIYLIGVVDDLKGFFSFVGSIGSVVCLGMSLIYRVGLEEASEKEEKVLKSPQAFGL